MEERLTMGENWIELQSSEASTIMGGIGFGNIKRILKLIGNFFGFAHEYYDDFKRGYENGWNLF